MFSLVGFHVCDHQLYKVPHAQLPATKRKATTFFEGSTHAVTSNPTYVHSGFMFSLVGFHVFPFCDFSSMELIVVPWAPFHVARKLASCETDEELI